MLTQVIDISYGSKERLQEILEEMLGEENFKLVQVEVTFSICSPACSHSLVLPNAFSSASRTNGKSNSLGD